MRSFNKVAVALILALSIGVQWPLLQSVAWLKMLISFSAREGIQQAVTKTFDGKHGCRLCKFVQEGKRAEKKSDTSGVVKKHDPMLAGTLEIRIERKAFTLPPAMPVHCSMTSYPPPTPPPDLA